ncbi:MAG TPA: class IV adenylate cyclase [Candidatus Acidoferrales bacterium]|nr:class IV adenylate cyclase [Candidatus Acidoferrales bacterium]
MPSRGRTVREIEVKLHVTDIDGLIRELRRLGCHCSGRVLERNTLFDTPDSDFRRRGRLLRVRIETPAASGLIRGGLRRTLITSKSPAPASARSRYKEKLERELAVRLPHSWTAILRSLGFRPGFSYEKYRTTFRLPGLHLDLDETPVGVFLELEGSPKAIDRVAGTLGFAGRDYIRATYWELNAAECRRRGRIPRNMLFAA